MSREAFRRRVTAMWAAHLGCEDADLDRPGTTLMPGEAPSGEAPWSGVVRLFYTGPHVIVRSDPALVGPVRRALPADRPLTAEDLIAALGPDRVTRGEVVLMHHVYPEDLRRCPPSPGMRLRSLGPADAEALAALHQACTPAEVEEAEVAVEDEVAFGCFAGPRLVAVASGYRLAGFMDIGVLTHPAFRRRGLGRAVVAAITRWCRARDVIPLYRCDAENAGSRGVAQAVGFRPYFRQVYLKEIR